MGKEKYDMKVPKGTKDWDGKDVMLRKRIENSITEVFTRYGGVTIDTPVFELKSTLTGKYGEDSKLIYDIADQGGELLSLRYDLTVPFARYLAMNQGITKIRRYVIAKVYRRDQPAMTKGRMREFYQCDFDIAGTDDARMADALIIRIICDVFEALGWDNRYTIKINNRKVLDGLFEICGVPKSEIRKISSAVDKLDKLPWEEVRREMTEEKGLDPEVADRIGDYVQLKGGNELVEKLRADEKFSANESAKEGLSEMEILFDDLDTFGISDRVSFDLSLARGLDYYTGIIYEVVTEGSSPETSEGQKLQNAGKRESKPKKGPSNIDGDEDRSNDPTVGVGSVAAGGRYDKLVGMFSGKKDIPCVGISFGVDRIFAITKQRLAADSSAAPIRTNEVDVYVMAFGNKGFSGFRKERMQVANRLWKAGIKTDYFLKTNPKLQQQFKAAEEGGVPWAVILGEDEWAAGKCKIKEMGLPEGDPEKDGVLVDLSQLEEEVKARLSKKDSMSTLTNGVNGTSLGD